MPKVLSIVALAISILVFLVFLADLVLGLLNMTHLAPFRFASPLMNIVFGIAAAILGWLSWRTFREQL